MKCKPKAVSAKVGRSDILERDDVGCLERHSRALRESELELLQDHKLEFILYVTVLYLNMLPGRTLQARILKFYKTKRSHYDPI